MKRRSFIRNVGCAAMGSTTMMSTILNLRTIGAEAYFNSTIGGGDYKAMVCLLLSGGNDSYNMLVPNTSEEYASYSAVRGNMALAKDSLLPINPSNGASGDFGLHNSCTNMQQLFNQGNLAFIANAGSLVERIERKEDYQQANVKTPLGLFSHVDMRDHWQTAIPDVRTSKGWAGKIADLLNTANEQNTLPMNLSFSGSNKWQTGFATSPYSLDPEDGAPAFNGYGYDGGVIKTRRTAAVDNIIEANYQDLFEQTYANTLLNAREGQEIFSEALQGAFQFTTEFSDNDLSNSFKTIAEIISVREQLQFSRQIFFLQVGGWDTHDNMVVEHAERLSYIDTAIGEFMSALDEVNMSDCVTTFSMSDFARKLPSNGDGTDHAWGGNMFVAGGAVKGQKIYGNYPDLTPEGSRTVGNGVLLPEISADEIFAELALWYGVPSSSLVDIFPNIGSFYNPMSGNGPIGFLL